MSRDRDRILEDALRHELSHSRPDAAAAHDCLDAETLAAWEENALDANSVAAIEAHVSTCARCQALVAVSAAGVAPGLEQPDTSALEHVSPFAFWKWLAPLAAGAAAVTLWMVVPDQQEMAVAPPEPSAAVEKTAPTTAPDASAATPPSATTADARPVPAAKVQDEARTVTAASAESARADAAPRREQQAPQPLAETVTVTGQSPVIPAPSAQPPAPAAPAIAGLQRNRVAFGPLEVATPDAAQRWRVSDAGIEHTRDAGATWSPVRASAGETIIGGTSPSADVCWLIGNNGVVLITTNGTAFTRIDITGAGNLRAITATDASSATVVSATGRTFRTTDGGKTWQ